MFPVFYYTPEPEPEPAPEREEKAPAPARCPECWRTEAISPEKAWVDMSHFGISSGKGFHMQFANGWCISVQFGWGNYCDNKTRGDWDDEFSERDRKLGAEGSSNAEVAVFDPKGNLVTLPGFMFEDPEYADVVSGWNSADKVLELMNWAASQKKE